MNITLTNLGTDAHKLKQEREIQLEKVMKVFEKLVSTNEEIITMRAGLGS